MNTLLFLTLFTLLGILYVVLGIHASRKVTTDTDYFIANRELGVWQISSNLIATQLGGGMLLGTASAAYTSGYYGILYTMGMALGFVLLACGIASRLQQFQVTTTAQLFETRYDSRLLKKIASLLSIVTLCGILIAQVIGFKSLMASIGFGAWYIVLPFWLSIIAYTMIGGLRAITINDMVQLVIITVTFTSIFVISLMNDTSAPFSFSSLADIQKVFTPEEVSLSSLTGVILMPALFALIEQDLAQRFFASKTSFVATMSAVNASVFLLLFSLIPVYLGMQARLTGLIIPEGASPLLVILEARTSPLIFAFALCALVAAIISTGDALMNGISANITQDFAIARFANLNKLTISKITTLCIGLVSLIASYFVSQNIIGIIISSYELSVACLLIPLLFSYFKKEVRKSAAYGAIVFGLISFVLFRIYTPTIPKELLILLCSLIGYGIGHYAGKK
jgi:SSS family solute:Na+ symporter